MKNEVHLGTDQTYVYEICLSISSNIYIIDLSRRNPSILAHSRWLTTPNTILFLYNLIKFLLEK